MIYEKDLVKAKNDVEKHIGDKVRVRFKNGKRKQRIKDGTIISAYNSIFLVELQVTEDVVMQTTYTYKDVLTKNVVISLI